MSAFNQHTLFYSHFSFCRLKIILWTFH